MYKVMFIDHNGGNEILDLNHIPKEKVIINVIDGRDKLVVTVNPTPDHFIILEPQMRGIEFVCVVEDLDSMLNSVINKMKQQFKGN